VLYSIDGDNVKQITKIPRSRRAFYKAMMRNMSEEDYNKIVDALNDHFDNVEEVEVSSFVPGSEWTGTVYEPIYHACHENVENAGFLFGLILWRVMIERPDNWGFVSALDRFEDREIKGKIYFRIDKPGERI